MTNGSVGTLGSGGNNAGFGMNLGGMQRNASAQSLHGRNIAQKPGLGVRSLRVTPLEASPLRASPLEAYVRATRPPSALLVPSPSELAGQAPPLASPVATPVSELRLPA